MLKLKQLMLAGLICLISVVFCSQFGLSQAPQPSVRLTVNPPVNQLLPFEAEARSPQTPVQLTLQALDGAGQPLTNVNIGLTILAPAKNPWFPTDFPIVEGTTLLDLEAQAPNGELQLQQMLPIRGTYRLFVKVTPLEPNAFTPLQQTLTLPIRENPVKYRNFGILAIALLAIGCLGGWIIGGRQPIRLGEIAPERVRLLLSGAVLVAIASLLIINLSTVLAESQPHSHSGETHSHSHTLAESQDTPLGVSNGVTATITGDSTSTVGQLADLSVNVIDSQTKQPTTDVLLKISTLSLENGWTAFAYQGTPDATGQLAWQQQFFDGAPHVLEVDVAPQPNATKQFPPFQISKTIDVEGVAPPLSSRLLVLAYLTCILVIGLLIGLQLQQKRA